MTRDLPSLLAVLACASTLASPVSAAAPSQQGASVASSSVDACRDAVKQKAWSDAVGLCQKATVASASSDQAWLYLGMAQERTQHVQDAMASLRRSLALKDTARGRYHLGYDLAMLGKTDGAVEMFRRAVELEPEFAPGWRELAHAELDLGDLAPSLVALSRAAQLLPNDRGVAALREALEKKAEAQGGNLEALGHQVQAQLLIDGGKTAAAEDELAKALALAPHYAEAHYALGKLARLRGELPRAEAEYRAAIASYRADQGAYKADAENNLADLLIAQRKNVSEAEQLVRSAIGARGERASYLDTLARACDAQHKRECAVGAFEQLLSHESELPPGIADHARQRLGALRK